MKKWRVWNGQYWEIDDTGLIDGMVKKTIKSILMEAFEETDDEIKKMKARHAFYSENKSRYNAIESLAKIDGRVIINGSNLDKNDWLLNCSNGTIHLKMDRLLPHKATNFITKFIPVDYIPEATCPTWDTFLHTIMGCNDEKIRYLQRVIGYCLTGSTAEQCFFILFGLGANGKTTFLNVIMKLLNDYAKQSAAETFLNSRRGVGNDIAALQGVRMTTATELDDGQRFAEGLLKQLTGGDTISTRFLHKEYFEFIPSFKLFVATNHKPNVDGTDHGFWRRVRVIPFDVSIPKEQEDHQLPHKLNEELPGILAWAVRGCIDWQKNGLREPQAVIDATNQYRREEDTMARFIEDCCAVGPDLNSTSANLYRSYTNWCSEEGEKSISQIRIGKQLEAKGFTKYRTSTTRGWSGICAR